MKSIRTLLEGIVDYAGLFPPAQLEMPLAVANYAAYREGETAWALGRFVLPAARLAEFEAAARDLLPRGGADPWRLSALGGADLDAEIAEIQAFNQRQTDAAVIDMIEINAAGADGIRRAINLIPAQITPYFEIPIDGDSRPLIAVLAGAGARAKVRTGGINQAAFPPADDLLRFLHACIAADVPFKATAGLHHPLRSTYRLTYEPDSPTGTMYGFLNLFLAAAFLRAGMNPDAAAYVLEESDPDAFRFDDHGIAWRAHQLGNEELARTRAQFAISFGSCSFQEPVDDLKGLGLL